VIQDEEFASVVLESDGVDQVSQNLVNLALDRQTDDNVSVITIHIRELSPAPLEKRKPPVFNLFRNRRKLVR